MENFTITHIGDYELLQPMPFIFIPAKGKEFTSELNRKKGVFADDFFMAAYPCTQEFWQAVVSQTIGHDLKNNPSEFIINNILISY